MLSAMLFLIFHRFMTAASSHDVKTSTSAPADSKMTSPLNDLHQISPKARGFLIEDILLNKPKNAGVSLPRNNTHLPPNSLAYLQRSSFHDYTALAAAFTATAGSVNPSQLQHPLATHPLFVPKPIEHAHPFLLGGMTGKNSFAVHLCPNMKNILVLYEVYLNDVT